MIKTGIKVFLQGVIGYDNYLYLFSLFTVARLRNNQHEREFVYFMDHLPDEGVILDIGANIGVMTVSLARRHAKAQIIAIEPVPGNIKNLHRIIDHYGLKNVKIWEFAVGEENGTLKMVLPIVNKMKMQGLSHVYKEADDSAWNKGEMYTVPVKKLDDLEELAGVGRITGIKIDVENFEYFVFRGAENLLRKHKPMIYCELWANEMRDKALDFLRGIGYTVKVFDGNGLVPYTNQNETNFFLV